MIKRPLLWLLAAYLAGLLLAWRHSPVWFILLIFILSFSAIYLLMFRIKNPCINHHDKFLWSLPLLLLLGFYAMGGQMKRPVLDQAFEEKAECVLTGRITMVVEKQSGKALYVKNTAVSLTDGNQKYLCENIIVYCKDIQKYLVGNEIIVSGEIYKFSEPVNPGQFNEKLYYQIENIDYKVYADEIHITDSGYSVFHALLDSIKKKLTASFDTILAKRQSGTLNAMLLGESNLLDEEVKQLYRENGISHILAISGLHVMLIGMFLFKFLRKIKVPLIFSTVLTILLIYCYGILTNFSVSTNRAVVMMVVMLLAAIFGKTYDMLSATSFSAFLILLQNPMQIFSAGFLLSFCAVLGIALFLPAITALFPVKNSILSGLYTSISAQLMTTPVILMFFYQFPTYSVIVNLLVLPFSSFLILTALAAGIAGLIYRPLGVFCVGGANYILIFYEWVCRIGGRLPQNMITTGKPDAWRVIIFLCLLLLFLWGVKRYRKKWLIILLPAAMLILLIPKQTNGLRITMLDVGQGEAIFMESESGTTYLFDGGSTDVKKVGAYRIQPFLLSGGVDTITYAIVSHTDSDHISGLTELLTDSGITVRHLVLPDTSLRDEAYEKLVALAGEKGVDVSYIKTGDSLTDGRLRLTCLHPAPGYTATQNNDYSMVLSVSYGEFDMLLTGDLSKDGEELVTRRLKSQGEPSVAVDYDVLQVAHHGSKSSTFEEFLKTIQPELSLISCGKDNSYGHPHEELLERLKEAGSDIRITYECGAIMITTDGEKMEVKVYSGSGGK